MIIERQCVAAHRARSMGDMLRVAIIQKDMDS
ncbi:hypothetical protein XVE_2619 [Xanthomonas vesicatoria ATCC 35937]|uniref:Uncharacterized protein n=1 Tax=Xanthomonas vesicatoria ATCC 35937 TaxID=925775 RepID=F0BEJ1_9XANT|nr:hypothetical protein XVE_2619 [Xanthomonas vesicatoria ATCC 35937]